jgi:N-acyl-L-homoserine lactone synthetase
MLEIKFQNNLYNFPMKIVRITDDASLQEIFAFRRKILIDECGYLPKNSGPLSDEFDPYSINYAAYDNNMAIVGAVRLVVDNPNGFPLERLFPLNRHRQGKQLTEACRFAISREYRSSRLFLKLVAATYQCALQIGCTHIVLDTYLNEEPLYRRLGFQRISEPYHDPVSKRNSLVVAMMIKVKEKSLYLNSDKALQTVFLSSQSEEIYHGKLTKQRAVLEKLPVY